VPGGLRVVAPLASPDSAQQRWHTKRRYFAVTAAVTLLLLVLTNVAMQFNRRFFDVLSSGGMGNEYDLLKVQECESLGRTPDVVLLGSSRTENGEAAPFVDQALDQNPAVSVLTCNMGMSGSTFESDYFALKRMIEDGYTPKLVIENAFEYNINANGGADSYSPAIYHATWLADASDASAFITSSYAPLGLLSSANFLAQKLIPVYGDRVGLLKTICQNVTWGPCGEPLAGVSWADRNFYLHDPDLGWHPLTDHNMGQKTQAEQQIIETELDYFRANYVQNFQLIKGPPPYLTKLVTLAHAHHIRVSLVVSPLHQLYRDLLTPQQWHAIMAYWETFSQTNGVAFFDQSAAVGYADSDFRDPHHLSAAGAEKFARWMAQNIVAPELGLTARASLTNSTPLGSTGLGSSNSTAANR
jgi:hypothetical protein